MGAGLGILIQMSDYRLQVTEVPIRIGYNIKGTSSENLVSHRIGVLMNTVRLINLHRPRAFLGSEGRSLCSRTSFRC